MSNDDSCRPRPEAHGARREPQKRKGNERGFESSVRVLESSVDEDAAEETDTYPATADELGNGADDDEGDRTLDVKILRDGL